MTYSLNPATTRRKTCKAIGLAIALAALVGCSTHRAANERTGSIAGSRNGQISITGVINKNYVPAAISAVKIGDDVGIVLNEQSVCGVSIQFSNDAKPSTYPIEDHLHQPLVDVFGEYDAQLCDDTPSDLRHVFLSTTGKLVLTSAGEKYSGTFEFTAANVKDESKTIRVSGSFNDVSRP